MGNLFQEVRSESAVVKHFAEDSARRRVPFDNLGMLNTDRLTCWDIHLSLRRGYAAVVRNNSPQEMLLLTTTDTSQTISWCIERKKRKRGRPRKLRSMGRYPWIPCMNAYLEAVRPFYGEKTMLVMRRGLRRIGKAFQELRESGKVSTTNPSKMQAGDIQAFVEWMNTCPVVSGIGLRSSTQAGYLGYLTNLLRWVENPVLDRMRTLRYVRLPQKVSPEIKVLSESTVENIRSALETMPDWEGSVARFMVAMYAYSGLRRSELRTARIQDIDTVNWSIMVVHPKGENRWASSGMAPILQPARQEVLRFLTERRQYLDSCEVGECEPLVPRAWSGGRAGYWSDGMWGKVKADAQEWAGIPFRIQTLRATFAQMCKDRGARIEAVSRALRHRTSRTTELYYARIRAEDAFRELEEVFSGCLEK